MFIGTREQIPVSIYGLGLIIKAGSCKFPQWRQWTSLLLCGCGKANTRFLSQAGENRIRARRAGKSTLNYTRLVSQRQSQLTYQSRLLAEYRGAACERSLAAEKTCFCARKCGLWTDQMVKRQRFCSDHIVGEHRIPAQWELTRPSSQRRHS